MPVVTFLPHFPGQPIDTWYGTFHLWRWHQHKAKYIPEAAHRHYLDQLFSIYKRPNGAWEDRITILSTSDSLYPDCDDVLGRFTSACMFCHLIMLPDEAHAHWRIASSDNFLAFSWPIDFERADLSIAFGSYFRCYYEGTAEELSVVTPQYVPMPTESPCERSLLRDLARLAASTDVECLRLFRSFDWIRLAFGNSTGFPFESRIVALATAFEILLDLPERGKGSSLSQRVNQLVPGNRMPLSQKVLRPKKQPVEDNELGWWCRNFYDLRSKIVHGDQLQGDWFLVNNTDQLKIGLSVFEECVIGLLVRRGDFDDSKRPNRRLGLRWAIALGVQDYIS
ncbi:MAG TPA: hypothetical protein VK335_18955 [Bryobacteraceae bacterium]|nr:hypothetical protein [Bryobacteraceae bacterium]